MKKSSSPLVKKSIKKNSARPPVVLKKKSFIVVAIGASVGGLKAFSTLVENLPVDTGMAFIYVQHLSRDHKSLLTSILSKRTKMKVQEIENMEHIAPNNIYVIPSHKGIRVTDGHIQLLRRPTNTATNVTIDVLFTSLANTHKENVVGVVLSGNANDGTKGLRAIKDAGGITFAQDASAEATSMPKSVIASGVVDFVLSPKEIAFELARIGKVGIQARKTKSKLNKDGLKEQDPNLKIIYELLQKKVNVDFSRYKTATVKRRISHRMQQCGVTRIEEYIKLLKKGKDIEILYKDLLINVTSFFREPDTFAYLKKTFLPILLKKKLPGETLRIWIAACSTGEEAFSIAMLLIELQETKDHKIPIQIFATDLSEQAITDARLGEYSKADVAPISKNRLQRFFTKTGNHYQVVKELREMCVFAPQNILRDPPFFRIDFVSCCNLLIYFDPIAQKRVFSTIHFSLNEGGYLMLGKSETTGNSQLFTQMDDRFKIYSRKRNTGPRKLPELTPSYSGTTIPRKTVKPDFKKQTVLNSSELDQAINSRLLSGYMPACAIINRNMEIIQFRGSTSLFLSHPSGKATLNILKMVHPEFAFELRSIIRQVIKTNQTVLKTSIEINSDVLAASSQLIALEVSPLKIEWEEPLMLVVFTLQNKAERYTESDKGGRNTETQKDRRIKKLMSELSMISSEMHLVIESQEKAYEELQVANEEIVSTNEEFQTLNEELETSKEEIEATNEELISTNQELKIQNELLAESYDYSQTIIATIHEPMIILDSNLRVKSANKSFYKKFHVQKEETEGMSLFELGNKQWEIPKLHRLLESIVHKNTHFENFEMTHQFPELGKKVMLLNANHIIQKSHGEKLILLAIEDITERHRRQRKEKENLKKNIRLHLEDKLALEKAVKRRTRQLEQKNVELESANRDLTTFTYVSSHDLQEPLRKIQNFVEFIQKNEKKNLSTESKGHFQRVEETAKRMQLLIEDLLKYARTKSPDLNFEKTDLNVILEEVKANFEEVIKEKKAVIRGSLCVLNVVPFQFRQLLQNLIGNSLKFTRPNKPPRITIKSKIERGSKLNIEKLSPKLNYCHMILQDNGIGFDPQYKDRIFEVFQRLHSYEKYKGTGIGLAICKRIIENHKGIITANSEVNKGVRFDIYVPAIEK